MSTDIFWSLAFIFGAIFNYYLWKERGDKNYLQLSLVSAGGLVVKVINYYIKNFLHLSPGVELIRSTSFLILWFVILGLIVIIALRLFRKR